MFGDGAKRALFRSVEQEREAMAKKCTAKKLSTTCHQPQKTVHGNPDRHKNSPIMHSLSVYYNNYKSK